MLNSNEAITIDTLDVVYVHCHHKGEWWSALDGGDSDDGDDDGGDQMVMMVIITITVVCGDDGRKRCVTEYHI
jgi:hypothetical protein